MEGTELDLTRNENASIYQGDVTFQGEIKDNKGIITGNVHGSESHAVLLTGSSQTVGCPSNYLSTHPAT